MTMLFATLCGFWILLNGWLAGDVLLVGLITAFLLALFRFLKGPSTADRVVAFDVLTIIGLTAIALLALLEGRGIYPGVALVYPFVVLFRSFPIPLEYSK